MRVLIVEDDKKLAAFVRKGLRENGCAVDVCHDGIDGAHLAATEAYDVIVLDIMLPGQSGYEVIRRVRRGGSSAPILCLSARDALEDKVVGLDLGADDYMVKPFHFSELLARVRALRRRSPVMAPTEVRVGPLALNPAAHTVARGGQPIELTPREFNLLEYLMRRAGTVVTRTAITENVWDMNFDSVSNVVDVFINKLREKVDRPFGTRLICTVRGVGYVLKEEES